METKKVAKEYLQKDILRTIFSDVVFLLHHRDWKREKSSYRRYAV